jgi:hypothetical protein
MWRPDGSVLLTPERGETIEGCKLKGADLFIENGTATKDRYRIISSEPSVFVYAVNVRVEKMETPNEAKRILARGRGSRGSGRFNPAKASRDCGLEANDCGVQKRHVSD